MSSSNYKQVRITLTEEAQRGEHPGLVTITMRVSVKPLAAEWQHKHAVLHERRPDCPRLHELSDVYATILDFLSQQPLPGHIG